VVVKINRVEAFLQHYDSQPYDPVKAHEYYLKNRQLQGRKTSGLGEKQKEAWMYTKDQISIDKKSEIEKAKVENDQKIEAFRVAAEETRNRISDKLKLLSEKLTKDAETERDSISNKVETAIANVAPIPKGVSGEKRAALMKKRSEEIAAIRDSAGSDREKVADETKSGKEAGRDEATVERKTASTDLKNLLKNTRDSYTAAKAKMVADYEDTYQKEYDKVVSTIKGDPKGKGKAKAKTKAKAKDDTNKKGIIYYTKAEMAANKSKG
jgi:hypothetical protein